MGTPTVYKFTRQHFELEVEKHRRNIVELQDQYKKGLLKKEDPVFTLEDLISICTAVGNGMWKNAGMVKNPNSKWGKETRCKVTREIILDAFAI